MGSPAAGDNSKYKDDDMSTNSAENFKNDLVSNAIKCGSCIVAAMLLVSFLVVFSTEVVAATLVALKWTFENLTLAVKVFYSVYAYWSWLPIVVPGVFIAAYLWLTCICASMKKKHLQSNLYARLDNVRNWFTFLSIAAVMMYVPASNAPEGFFLVGLFYMVVLMFMRVIEMQEDEKIKKLLSAE
jgi:hypothetical protein